MDELAEYLATSSEDGVWEQIQSEAREEAGREPVLVSFLFANMTSMLMMIAMLVSLHC